MAEAKILIEPEESKGIVLQHKILITGKIDSDAIKAFQENPSYQTSYLPDLPREELLKHIQTAHVLVTRSETPIDQDLINQAPSLKLIARAAVGVANIDIEHATKKGILVVNAPGVNTNSAAELTWTLLLSMLRKSYEAQEAIKEGRWDRHRFCGYELKNKKIGIVGLGNVGHRVAKFAHGFDMDVYGYDPYIHSNLFKQYQVKSLHTLEELASKVDILTFHVPLTRQTKGMVNLDILKRMKKDSFIINASRGGVINEKDLLIALDKKLIQGAALDTWVNEPNINQTLRTHPLVYGTPHIGASTAEAQKKIGELIYDQVSKSLEDRIVDYPVNLPKYTRSDSTLINSYALLSEKIGSFLSQYIHSNPNEIILQRSGKLLEIEHELIVLGFMKGYMTNISEKYISYVNARNYFDKLGIQVKIDKEPHFCSDESSIKYKIIDEDGYETSVTGSVIGRDRVKLTNLEGFSFEMTPRGKILVVRNIDKPGVIGHIGLTLASHNVNIESFILSRQKEGGDALALIRVDSAPKQATLKEIRNLDNIRNVSLIRL